MNWEEWNKLTKEELVALPLEEFLKHLIKFTEERYISYKKMLEDMFKDKVSFPPGDEFTEWYKELLREGKNREEGCLKELRIEMEHCRQGMNPPYCYPEYWKSRDKKVKVQCPTCEGKGTILKDKEEKSPS